MTTPVRRRRSRRYSSTATWPGVGRLGESPHEHDRDDQSRRGDDPSDQDRQAAGARSGVEALRRDERLQLRARLGAGEHPVPGQQQGDQEEGSREVQPFGG